MEEMAAGKAMVSTSIGLEGIEVKEGKHFIIADRLAYFSKKVVELLNDSLLQERLGANARKVAEGKYDWRAICDKMSGIHRDAKNEFDRQK